MKNLNSYKQYAEKSGMSEKKQKILVIGVILSENAFEYYNVWNKNYKHLLLKGHEYITDLELLQERYKEFNDKCTSSQWESISAGINEFKQYFDLKDEDIISDCIQSILDYVEGD